MFGEDVTAAGLAPFAIAFGRLVVSADVVGTLRNLNGVRVPQTERIHGSCGPVPTGLTMAVAHCSWLAADSEPNRATETTSVIGIFAAHHEPP
jgi:hypothetical protein